MLIPLAASVVVACSERPEEAVAPTAGTGASLAEGSVRSDDVWARAADRVRRLTARYQRFGSATEAGYTLKITDCMTHGQLGGMGFHYGHPGLLDGAVALDRPEVLLYEPQRNGRLELVGVEYVVPYPAWTGSEPPVLLGQRFRRNDTFQVYALHFWIWRSNPAGILADWNRRVSCAVASRP
jgi:hypothetical protein